MLGKGLKDLPRGEIVLATKFGRYGPNLFDFSAERVRGVHQSSCVTRPHVTHLTEIAYLHVYCAMYFGSIISVCECNLTLLHMLHRAKDCT